MINPSNERFEQFEKDTEGVISEACLLSLDLSLSLSLSRRSIRLFATPFVVMRSLQKEILGSDVLAIAIRAILFNLLFVYIFCPPERAWKKPSSQLQ